MTSRVLLGSSIALLMAAAPGVLLAQAGAAATADDPLGEVVVTGSRIQRPNLESTVPITTVDVQDLVQQGDINIGDALNDLPSLRSTFSQGNSGRFIGTAGLSLLDLRGLGTSRTLVLVNNRRHITSSPGDFEVDVNTIPSDLIERVDVVTGGNSAVYGSDAVAGVVNFVTKRDFQGIKLRSQTGISGEGDRKTLFASAVFGTNFADNRGNVAGAIEFSKSDPLYFTERDGLTGAFSGRSQFNLAEPTAGEPASGDGVTDNQFFTKVFNASIGDGGVLSIGGTCATLPEPAKSLRCLPNGQKRIYSFRPDGTLAETTPVTDFRPFGSGNVQLSSNPNGLSTLRNTGQLAVGLERVSANVMAHFEVSPAFRPFVEAKYVAIDAVQEGQPSFWQGSIPGFFGGGANLSCSNPFLSAQALATIQTVGGCATPTSVFTISRFNTDFGGRGEQHERDTYRVVFGADGIFNDDWKYEVAINYGRLETGMRSVNNLKLFDLDGNDDGFLLAINAVRNAAGQIVCGVNADADPTNDKPSCVPINVFGSGAPSKEALAFVNTTGLRDEWAEQLVVSAYVSGDSSEWFSLPGGPVGFAVGAEGRTEDSYSAYDELTAFGGTFLNAIQPFDPPKYRVKEYFGELRLPLLADKPLVRELTAELAGRSSEYNSSTGTVSAYNLGLVYSPVQGLRLRGNYSTSVRAPTPSDLYSPLSENFAQIADPCDVLYIGTNPNRVANCAAAGVPVGFENTPARSASTGFVSGGNPTLLAEEGRSITLGAVLTPTFLPGFSVAFDYYDITVTNLIASLGAQTIISECYNSPAGINNSYCATVNRNPDFTFAEPAVIAGGINFAKQKTTGVDVDVSYVHSFDNGHRLQTRFIATKLMSLINYTNPSLPNYPNRQMNELGDPDMAFNVNVGYTAGRWDFDYNLRYIGRQTIGAWETQNSYAGRPPENLDAYPFVYYPTATYHAVRGQYEINDKISAYVGVDNLMDKQPPLGLLGTSGGDPFDTIGRYFYFGINAKL